MSYVDLNRGHEGKIYQASNWIFVGMTGHEAGIMLNGKLTHRRTINSKYGTSDIDWRESASIQMPRDTKGAFLDPVSANWIIQSLKCGQEKAMKSR